MDSQNLLMICLPDNPWPAPNSNELTTLTINERRGTMTYTDSGGHLRTVKLDGYYKCSSPPIWRTSDKPASSDRYVAQRMKEALLASILMIPMAIYLLFKSIPNGDVFGVTLGIMLTLFGLFGCFMFRSKNQNKQIRQTAIERYPLGPRINPNVPDVSAPPR